ncbi:MAG: hypothetical protein ACI4AD_13865 [Roseburia sp.]
MDKKEKYEVMYKKIVSYEQEVHEKNQKRIRIGLKCILIIPLIFLFFLFWTDSNKVVFLILWIVSLFLLAAYLIVVEYMDFNLQEQLNEWKGEDKEVDTLLGKEFETVESNLANVMQKIDDTLNSKAEVAETVEKDGKEAEEGEHA